MGKLIEIMVHNKQFATPELLATRTGAALARPDHLENYLAGLPKGAPIPNWVRLENLPGVDIPTLLIHGRDDRVVPFEHSLMLLALIPNLRLVIFNHCWHWAMIEHPDEFNRLVIDFIANN